MLTLAERIIKEAERRFQLSGQTAFPTVREVARSCRCRQRDVEQACEDTQLACLQGYNVEGWRLGDLEVYVYGDQPCQPDKHASFTKTHMSLQELARLLHDADHITAQPGGKESLKTRIGAYLCIKKGLRTTLVFVGINEHTIPIVEII